MTAHQKSVVVVGDTESDWTDSIRVLNKAGILVQFLETGASPEEVARSARPDGTILVVDLSGDPAKGMELVSACRRLVEHAPMVVVSDDSSVGFARRIRSAGVFYQAVAPVSPEEMLSILHDAFRYQGQKRSSASICKDKKKIIIIDDDVDFLASTTSLLNTQGYVVLNARSGKDALTKVLSEQPDLIVLDVMMEHTSSGYEVNQAIKYKREYQAVRNTPILMVSAITLDPVTRFSTAGEMEMVTPDGYMTKPLDIPMFLSTVRSLLGDSQEQQESQGQRDAS